jgi:hypothetical protein
MPEVTGTEILTAINTLAANVATKADIERVECTIQDFDKVLFRGNGHPPLVPQVREMRKEMDEYKAQRSKGGDFFREKLLAPVITGITVAVAMLIIAHFFK